MRLNASKCPNNSTLRPWALLQACPLGGGSANPRSGIVFSANDWLGDRLPCILKNCRTLPACGTLIQLDAIGPGKVFREQKKVWEERC